MDQGLWRMSSAIEMAEFILLWEEVQQLQFNDSQDTIKWKWAADGSYTAKSAYNALLVGTHSTLRGDWIWKALAEGKHKFFTWLLVQHKILTADNLLIRNWPCEQKCAFCDQVDESAPHVCLNYNFAVEVWLKVKEWTGLPFTVPTQANDSFADWWHHNLLLVTGWHRRNLAAVLMYTASNLWLERNRSVFEKKLLSVGQVAGRIKEDITLRQAACGTPEFESSLVS